MGSHSRAWQPHTFAVGKSVCRRTQTEGGLLTAVSLREATFVELQINMITCGKTILYNPLLYKAHREQARTLTVKLQ
jgi:hypothetical protein